MGIWFFNVIMLERIRDFFYRPVIFRARLNICRVIKILSSHINRNLLFGICALDILELKSWLPLEFFEWHRFIFWVSIKSTYCWHIHSIWSLRELPIVGIRHISFIYIYIYYVIKYRSSFSLIYICPRQAQKFSLDSQD